MGDKQDTEKQPVGAESVDSEKSSSGPEPIVKISPTQLAELRARKLPQAKPEDLLYDTYPPVRDGGAVPSRESNGGSRVVLETREETTLPKGLKLSPEAVHALRGDGQSHRRSNGRIVLSVVLLSAALGGGIAFLAMKPSATDRPQESKLDVGISQEMATKGEEVSETEESTKPAKLPLADESEEQSRVTPRHVTTKESSKPPSSKPASGATADSQPTIKRSRLAPKKTEPQPSPLMHEGDFIAPVE